MIREKEMGEENVKIRDEENRIRSLFLTDPTNAEIQNPYCHLIDVFAEKDSFQFKKDGTFSFAFNR